MKSYYFSKPSRNDRTESAVAINRSVESINKKQDATTQKESMNKAKVNIKNLIRVMASKE